MNSEEYQIKINQMQIAIKHWHRQPAAPTILALHGWLDNVASFDALAFLLTEFNVVCIDLPGHGYSGHRPDDVPYHLVDYIYDIIAVADALQLDDFILMGHSLGGGIGSVLAASFPERVSHLILLDVLGPMSDDQYQVKDTVREFVLQRLKLNQKKSTIYPSLTPLIQARYQVGGLSMQSAQQLIERAVQAVEGGYIWRSDPRVRVRSPLRLSEAQAQTIVSAIQAPTLVIHASETLQMIDQMIELRLNLLAQGQYTQLQGGHHLHMTQAEAVAPHIKQFLANRSE